MIPSFHKLGWFALLCLCACHDAPRDNPFDPVLTPAVELQVALDDTSGTALLRWTQYEGQQPFREYRALRNEVERTRVDTLAAIPQIGQATYADTTLAPNTAYEYRVETVNAGGYAHASAPKRFQGYVIQAVALLETVVDPQSAAANLRWSPFTGARFQAYRVERRSGEEADFGQLVRLAAVGDTSFADPHLAPDIAYFYRITVEAAGRLWPSAPSSRVSYGLEGIQLLEAQVDARTGYAGLVWTAYTGPGFEGYAVLRQQAGEEFQQVGWVTTPGDTAFADGPLAPDIDYAYQVRVHAAGRTVESNALRKNHFSLAPVRLLSSQADGQAGVIRLGWGAFAGPGFAAYRVLRRPAGTGEDEVLAVLAQRTDTTYVDQGAQHGVDYEYSVPVEASGQQLSSEIRVSRLVLPAVQLTSPAFSAATASAALAWTPYAGPRFRAYRVERRTAALVTQPVAEIGEGAVISLVDSSLDGNTEYFYKVVVLTTQNEEVESEEQRGLFHQRMATWPLELEAEEYVRLYREGERITALVSSPSRVRLLFFDAQGLAGEQVLLRNPFSALEPRAVATALNPEGERFLSLGIEDQTLLLRFDPQGRLVWPEPQEVFADSLPRLSGEEARVEGAISLYASGDQVRIDNVEVSTAGRLLFAEDFESGSLEGNWDYQAPRALVAEGQLQIPGGGYLGKADESWRDFRLEAEVTLGAAAEASTTINIGGQGLTHLPGHFSNFFLGVAPTGYQPIFDGPGLVSQQLRLTWNFAPPQAQNSGAGSRIFKNPFQYPKGCLSD